MNNKLILSLILCTAMMFCASACKETDKDIAENITETKTEIAVNEIADSIISQCTFPDMYVLSADDLYGEYGLEASHISDFYAAVPTEYPGIERIFIAKAADAADIGTIVARLNLTFETVKAEYKDYLPDEYTKTRDAKVISQDNFVSLVICEDAQRANDIIKNHIK